MWNTPGRRWEKPLDDLMVMSGLGSWDSGGRSAVYCHNIDENIRPIFLLGKFSSNGSKQKSLENSPSLENISWTKTIEFFNS